MNVPLLDIIVRGLGRLYDSGEFTPNQYTTWMRALLPVAFDCPIELPETEPVDAVVEDILEQLWWLPDGRRFVGQLIETHPLFADRWEAVDERLHIQERLIEVSDRLEDL